MVTYFKDDTHLTAIFQDNVVSRYQNVFVLYFICDFELRMMEVVLTF